MQLVGTLNSAEPRQKFLEKCANFHLRQVMSEAKMVSVVEGALRIRISVPEKTVAILRSFGIW
jgi:hypothetical protein